VNVALIRLLNLPILLIITVYERAKYYRLGSKLGGNYVKEVIKFHDRATEGTERVFTLNGKSSARFQSPPPTMSAKPLSVRTESGSGFVFQNDTDDSESLTTVPARPSIQIQHQQDDTDKAELIMGIVHGFGELDRHTSFSKGKGSLSKRSRLGSFGGKIDSPIVERAKQWSLKIGTSHGPGGALVREGSLQITSPTKASPLEEENESDIVIIPSRPALSKFGKRPLSPERISESEVTSISQSFATARSDHTAVVTSPPDISPPNTPMAFPTNKSHTIKKSIPFVPFPIPEQSTSRSNLSRFKSAPTLVQGDSKTIEERITQIEKSQERIEEMMKTLFKILRTQESLGLLSIGGGLGGVEEGPSKPEIFEKRLQTGTLGSPPGRRGASAFSSSGGKKPGLSREGSIDGGN
jgi:hypothetical protein